MKWKLLLLLALVSVSAVVAQSEEDVEKSDSVTVEPNDDDVSYVDEDEEVPAVKIEEAKVEDPIDNESLADPETFDAQVDEDSVDVNVQDVKPRKGNLYNYEDYFLQSALDASDTNYNWNGELIGLSEH